MSLFLTFRVFANLSQRTGTISTNSYYRRLLLCSEGHNAAVTRGKKTKSMLKGDRMLEKMMTRGAGGKKKKRWVEFSSPSESSLLTRGKLNTGSARRAQVLSSVLHEHISGLIASGEIEPKLVELGLEISKIKVAEYCNAVSIHWVVSGTSRDDQIEALLPAACHKIRLQLSMLKVMGNVPPISFVKDKKIAMEKQVDYLLSIADMGPEPEFNEDDTEEDDLHPKGQTEDILDPSLTTSQTNNLTTQSTIDNLALRGIKLQKPLYFPTMELRSDILHLSHNKLVKEIQDKKRKAKDRSYVSSEAQTDLKISFSDERVKFKDITKLLDTKKNIPQKMSRHEKRELMETMTYMHWRNETTRETSRDEEFYHENYDPEFEVEYPDDSDEHDQQEHR